MGRARREQQRFVPLREGESAVSRTKLFKALGCVCIVLGFVSGCTDKNDAPALDAAVTSKPAEVLPKKPPQTEPPPPELLQPVALWQDGQRAGYVDAQGPEAGKYVFLDLGEGWTPVLFTDGVDARGEPVPHKFRETYLALARGEFPKDAYGERAKEDKYLELYGIMPTVAVMRARMKWARELACAKELNLGALATFTGVVAYVDPATAARTHKKYLAAEKRVRELMATQKVDDPTLLDAAALADKERTQLAYYLEERDDTQAIEAAQQRLACEGYFKGKGAWVKGAFDWPTHEALAEFERRHRVYSWGVIGPSTIAALHTDTVQAEHETVVRVLTERAMHAFGALEDGSAKQHDGGPITFRGADGLMHPLPNLEAALRAAVIQGFGLRAPEDTYAFLESVGPLSRDGHLYVAIPGPARPEYHSDDMDLQVVIDRGDVWYEFPFDEAGRERQQPVSRRPHTNIYVNYMGQRILLARFGTTIGGWKSEQIEESVWWKYKESPPGDVLWREIVSAPVWLPPASTPPRDLLRRRERRKKGEPKWQVNYHETGPSYASAYGLVAAYHRLYLKQPDGGVRVTGDEGIRSHGSVDYMSIMRRHSHGCHRLHNHIAVRLFSFVVSHRPHVRTGHQPTAFVMDFEYEKERQHLEIKRGGYVFKLDRPIFVTVEEGRIRGKLDRPIAHAIPKFNTLCKAYYLPDGRAVVPRADGVLLPATAPVGCDPGLPPLPPVAPPSEVLGALPPGEATLVNSAPLAPAPSPPVVPPPTADPRDSYGDVMIP